MASQLNFSHSTVGMANVGGVNIAGDYVVCSSSEESFEDLDVPRESEVFKGREEVIDKLKALFFKQGKRKVVIHGLPGFGKTELAVQFAMRCKDSKNIDKAFWINAETSENLKSLRKTLKKVYKNFANKRCLFIFDNGISRKSISKYEPPNVDNFYLLVTSHIDDWNDDIYQMSLKPLNIDASLDVFKEILGGRYEENQKEIYTEMITFVSNVPLGLIVIAGHLRDEIDAKIDTNHFFGEISRMLDTNIHHSQNSNYEKSIYATMIVVLEKMYKQDFAESEQTREGSMTVVGICAYLNPDYIHISYIKEIMESSEENTLKKCVHLSKKFSFIEYDKKTSFIKIHRLCQSILKLYFDKNKKDYYSVCLCWLLRKKNSYYLHEQTILMEADNKKETVLAIFQQNVSKNQYPYIETLLTLLVKYGCCESSKLIFSKISFEKSKQFVDNMLLIHHAIAENQADVLKLLLEYGDLNVQNYEDDTPLHCASKERNVDMVRMLLEKGADMHVRDNVGGTPLHCASWGGNVDIVQMLLEKGADVNVRDIKGNTPLHIVSSLGNVDMMQMLLEKGADVHVRDSEGKTPLHWASLKRHIDIVRMLLEKGADMHVLDNDGKTPLHLAYTKWNVDIELMQLLLEKGANVNCRDSEGKTLLHWAYEEGNTEIMRILLEKGTGVNVQDNEGKTPLHWASEEGNINIMRILLEKGADVNVQDNEGKTPLHWASKKENVDMVRILLEKGAEVHVRDSKGKTPLHCAPWYRNTDIVRMLLEKGADAHARDNEGHTSLDCAIMQPFVDELI